MSTSRFLNLLMADDDADDRMLFDEAIKELDIHIDVNFVKDGMELMDYLSDSGFILPNIVFIDLNMPFKTGFQCLEEIRSNKNFEDIFLVLYSTTARPMDIDLGFKNEASLFINKPSSYTQLKDVLQTVLTTDMLKISPSREEFMFQN